MTKSEIAKNLTHYIELYGYNQSQDNQEYLAKIFYFAGLLAGEHQDD